MASATTELRGALIEILQNTFAAEGFPVKPGRVHPSQGERGAVAGVYPLDKELGGDPAAVVRVGVQVFDRWVKQVKPELVVDASKIEDWAERFERATHGVRVGDQTQIWWFNVIRIEFQADPTGQVSRFEALVEARGPNYGVVETSA